MLSSIIGTVPLAYTVLRYYSTIISFLKFFILEVVLLYAFALHFGSDIFQFIVDFLLFYSLYEIGYYLNDTIDVRTSSRTINSNVLFQFRSKLWFRLVIVLGLSFISSAHTLYVSFFGFLLFVIFNYCRSYLIRGLLLTSMAFIRFYAVVPLFYSFDDLTKGLYVALFSFPYVLQKVFQYYIVKGVFKKSIVYHVFGVWLLIVTLCVYYVPIKILFFCAVTGFIYWILFIRGIINEKA